MILLAICVFFIGAIGFIAIPSDVRSLMAQNCRGSSGHLKFNYICREMLAAANFFVGVFFFATVLAIFSLVILMLVDEHLIPMGLVGAAMNENHSQLATGPDSVSAQHQLWFVVGGGTPENARRVQIFLWVGFPYAVCACFAGLLLCLRLTSRSYGAALGELVDGATARDRQRVTERYLRTTEQYKRRRRSSVSRAEAFNT